MTAAKTLGEQQERQVARSRLVARLVQRDDVVDLFRALRSVRGTFGLRLDRSTLQAWVEDDDAMGATIGALKPAVDAAYTEEESRTSTLLRSLELNADGMDWLRDELRAAFVDWLKEQDWADDSAEWDLFTLISEALLSSAIRLALAEQKVYTALRVEPPRSPAFAGVVPQRLIDRAQSWTDAMISADIIPEESADVARDFLAELPVAETWAQGLLEGIESDVGPQLAVSLDLPSIASLRLGTDTKAAHAAIERWAYLGHALVDANSTGGGLPPGRKPDKRRQTIERDVDLFYQARVGHESHRSLARSEFGDPGRAGEIRDRIAVADRLLTVGDSEAA